VVVSAPRTGSSLLASLLRDHPSIVCYSELFHPQRVVLGPDHKIVPRDELLEYRRSRPLEFYHDVLHGYYESGIDAVGVKLLYQQACSPGESVVWMEMARDPDLRVVHVTRGNHLAQLISIAQGNKTGAWTSTDSGQRPPITVALRPEHCEVFFRNTQRAITRQRERFASHPCFELDYDELSEDKRTVLTRLQTFLGVEPRELSSPLQRQNPHPPQLCVENYAELARHFRDTPWSRFFE
jgi:LPS sulfotransferase NodH